MASPGQAYVRIVFGGKPIAVSWSEAKTIVASLKAIGITAGPGASLPPLTGTVLTAFEGSTYTEVTFKAGTVFYRAGGWHTDVGAWLGLESVTTREEAEAAYNIVKWNNPREVMRTYSLLEDTTMYYGRVEGGEGYQALVPRGIDLESILKNTGLRVLR